MNEHTTDIDLVKPELDLKSYETLEAPDIIAIPSERAHCLRMLLIAQGVAFKERHVSLRDGVDAIDASKEDVRREWPDVPSAHDDQATYLTTRVRHDRMHDVARRTMPDQPDVDPAAKRWHDGIVASCRAEDANASVSFA